MVGWHHRLNGHEFEQTVGDGEGQESLTCCSPWGHKESDTTEQLNSNNKEGEAHRTQSTWIKDRRQNKPLLCVKSLQLCPPPCDPTV